MRQPVFVYSSSYELDLGGHVFPTGKYRLIRDRLLGEYGYTENDFTGPGSLKPEILSAVHSAEYINKVLEGRLSLSEQLKMELPFSQELALTAIEHCSGTLRACRIAAESERAVHIGGGFHHAFPDHGEGFCVFNDVALAAELLSREGKRILIVDCDVHQGNGTAACLRNNSRVFTFSIHQENNYPVIKEKSNQDIGLEDGTGGEEYNRILVSALEDILNDGSFDLAIYVAGADTFMDDQLGGLALTAEDHMSRDKAVLELMEERKTKSVAVMAGGYASKVSLTVNIQAATADLFAAGIS